MQSFPLGFGSGSIDYFGPIETFVAHWDKVPVPIGNVAFVVGIHRIVGGVGF